MAYYGPKVLEDYMMALWYPDEWLSGAWSREKQQHFNEMYNFSIAGFYPYRPAFDNILNKRNDEQYMDRYGVDYSDVKDPRKLSQSRSGVLGSSLNFVSSNVKRLYR